MDTLLRLESDPRKIYQTKDNFSTDDVDKWLSEWELAVGELYKLDNFTDLYLRSYYYDGAGGPSGMPTEVIISVSGAAGVIASELIRVFRSFLTRDENRELTIEREGKKLTLKGHSLPEERELLAELFPEALKEQIHRPDD